jgi:hypothetical protein
MNPAEIAIREMQADSSFRELRESAYRHSDPEVLSSNNTRRDAYLDRDRLDESWI